MEFAKSFVSGRASQPTSLWWSTEVSQLGVLRDASHFNAHSLMAGVPFPLRFLTGRARQLKNTRHEKELAIALTTTSW